ncbi:TlpA family protein disulfide reductase [Labilibacter marinus]|uniref:TlpA family protein disulfide reductase n=1 Tax=Labilibacter marinus TaxID=1477105 RepID=UPI00082E2B7D|nr:TlpA disulfide reductase family protein [Labilibacter marinus]
MMYKYSLLLVIFLISAISCTSQKDDDRGYIVNVGDVAPNFTAKLDNGDTFKLSEYKGKVVMLQFTASWCGVCRKEMPFIEKEIWQEHKDKAFVIVGIDRDEPLEKLNKLSKATGITYPLALDPGADIFGLYALKEAGVTRNVIIDQDGKIAYLTRLFNEEEFNAMKGKIEELLKK